MKNLLKLSFFGLIVAAVSSTSVEAAMLIDHFDDTQGNGTTEVIGLPGFGTTADRELASPLGPPNAFGVSGSFLTVSRFLSAPSDFMVVWDDFGGSGSSLDFTGAGANNGFVLGGATYFGPAILALTLEIFDGSGIFTSTVLIPGDGSTADVFVPFSSFSGPGIADFSSVSSLVLDSTLHGTTIASFSLDSISVGTPEPSSLILCGFGLAAAGAYSYRRRRQAVKVNA